MTRSKNQKRKARLIAEAKAQRVTDAYKRPPRAGTNTNAHGRHVLVKPRTDGLGSLFRCDRCHATTLGGAKTAGKSCRLTRGCKGHLKITQETNA